MSPASACSEHDRCSKIWNKDRIMRTGTSTKRPRPASMASRGARSGRKSTTIDIHSHVAIPPAGAFVKPHLDMARNPAVHFADGRTRAVKPEAGGGHPARIAGTTAAARSRRHGHRHAAHHAAADSAIYTVPLDDRGPGHQHGQRRDRRIRRAQQPDRFVALGTVPLADGDEAAKELERCEDLA